MHLRVLHAVGVRTRIAQLVPPVAAPVAAKRAATELAVTPDAQVAAQQTVQLHASSQTRIFYSAVSNLKLT